MSGASAKSLLGVIRYSAQVKGISRPNTGAVDAMKKGLARELAKLNPSEFIDVLEVAEKPLHVRYIVRKTGELLADVKREDE
jgi:hypothetical protein